MRGFMLGGLGRLLRLRGSCLEVNGVWHCVGVLGALQRRFAFVVIRMKDFGITRRISYRSKKFSFGSRFQCFLHTYACFEESLALSLSSRIPKKSHPSHNPAYASKRLCSSYSPQWKQARCLFPPAQLPVQSSPIHSTNHTHPHTSPSPP
jgi:hypothetical protein